MSNEKLYGVWLKFPENKPANCERVLIKTEAYYKWQPAVYNEGYGCWDDNFGESYLYDLDSVKYFMRIPEIDD